MFAAVYFLLARALDAREREALEVRAAEYADAFEAGGVTAVRALLEREREQPHVRSLFVRIVGPGGDVTFAKVPENWIDEDTQVLVPDGWGALQARRVQTVRVPRDEQRDLAVVSRGLPGGALLQVARSTDNRAVLLAPLRRTMWLAGTAAVLLSAGGGAWLAWRATKPVRAVAATAHRIVATGDLSARVEGVQRDDEVGELVRQFNTLLERNGNLLRAMREALDNVAHDLRTPLTRLRAGAETALQQTDDPAATREALADCIEETDRIQRLLETLLDISAAENGVLKLEREKVDVGGLLQGVAELYALVAEEKSIALQVAPATGLSVMGRSHPPAAGRGQPGRQRGEIHPGGRIRLARGGSPRQPGGHHRARHRTGHSARRTGKNLAAALPRRPQPLAARTRTRAQRREGAGRGPWRHGGGGEPSRRRRGVHRRAAGEPAVSRVSFKSVGWIPPAPRAAYALALLSLTTLTGRARVCTSVRSFSTKRLERHHAFVAFRARTHRHGLRLGFLAADHERVGHLLHLGAADLGAELVGVLVERGAEAGVLEPGDDLAGVVADLVADRQHAHLLGRQPRREIAGEVLDEHAARSAPSSRTARGGSSPGGAAGCRRRCR